MFIASRNDVQSNEVADVLLNRFRSDVEKGKGDPLSYARAVSSDGHGKDPVDRLIGRAGLVDLSAAAALSMCITQPL